MAILNNILKGQSIWLNRLWDIKDKKVCVFWDTLCSFLACAYGSISFMDYNLLKISFKYVFHLKENAHINTPCHYSLPLLFNILPTNTILYILPLSFPPSSLLFLLSRQAKWMQKFSQIALKFIKMTDVHLG